ncbi:hypothetical protein ACFO1B_03825 [Dactylosporangium siamense]|uniref:hypothetical protein n=1 Tax=Dactylosporangium siamense TaxID=685454 RepID=UPI001941C3C7|nr:hypothetical protein [Dactylosporangium siamense]
MDVLEVRPEDVADYIGVDLRDANRFMVIDLVDTAVDLINAYVGARIPAVPSSVLTLATKQLCSELYARRNAPSGIAQWTPDGQPVRLARDPMTSVKPLLQPYRSLGRVG